MAASVTVTGKMGPAQTLTAQVFNNVSEFNINADTEMLKLVQATPNRVIDIDISAATTITVTVSGSTYTVTIS